MTFNSHTNKCVGKHSKLITFVKGKKEQSIKQWESISSYLCLSLAPEMFDVSPPVFYWVMVSWNQDAGRSSVCFGLFFLLLFFFFVLLEHYWHHCGLNSELSGAWHKNTAFLKLASQRFLLRFLTFTFSAMGWGFHAYSFFFLQIFLPLQSPFWSKQDYLCKKIKILFESPNPRKNTCDVYVAAAQRKTLNCMWGLHDCQMLMWILTSWVLKLLLLLPLSHRKSKVWCVKN